MGRTAKFLVVVVSISALFAAEAQAQSRRSSSRRSAGTRQSGSVGRNATIPPGFGFGTHPGFSGQSGTLVPIGAATGNTATTSGTATRRALQPITPPAGYRLPNSNFYPGFFPTPEPVYGGMYVAGYGVNNGFARPEAVYGGMYTPGFGVNNGAAPREAVAGGAYVPGFGVTGGAGGTAGAGNFGSNTAVQGGNLIPGLGVVKNLP